MEANNLTKELELAAKAAKDAGKFLLRNKKDLNLLFDSDPKDTKLKADVSSEDLIKEIITTNSDYPILAEESGKSSDDLGDTFWVIDPLDGTANFNRDIPICCVSIGLVRKMKPLLGVIYDFNNDDLYEGNNLKNTATLNKKHISVSDINKKSNGILVTGLPLNTNYSDNSLSEMIADMQSWKKVRMIGSAAIASCYIASGRAELYKETGVYLWDIIAGASIVEAAGGKAEILNMNESFQVDVVFSNSNI
tara:strand:- start:44 stop:793 length:750 start_codon:yes stop_codon:yes gene_type:complete